MNSDNSEFRTILKEIGFNQRRLARRLGYSDKAVSQWAHDKQKVPQPVIEWLRLYVKIKRALEGTGMEIMQ